MLGTTYNILDDAATVASALTGDAEVNGANSITTNGGAVSLSFTDADSLLNGNEVAPRRTGSVAADVTVTTTSTCLRHLCAWHDLRHFGRRGDGC